uniref:sperm microtubule associated protein 2-like n=1 Tax=Pristiophorus japonicus TaxID=55135 RepID=UPI00398F6456
MPTFVKLSAHKKLHKRFQPNRPVIWPVKSAAMRANPSARIYELVQPKSIHKDSTSKRSIYGEDKLKAGDGQKGKTSRSNKGHHIYADVPRFIYLSEPKKLAEGYKSNRSTPIWPVRRKTMRALPSSRIYELAKPKQVHKDWLPDRSVYTTISENVLYGTTSSRTDMLAKHKTHIPPPARKSYLWDYPYWDHEISETAKTVKPTNRIVKLATPKGDYAGFVHNRPLDQLLSEIALNYTATERIQELAKPKIRIAPIKAEDPFEISEAAKNAVASARLQQLALPYPRNVTRKKFT